MSDSLQSRAIVSQSQPTVEEIIEALGPDTSVTWDIHTSGYVVYIRPLGGGFPLVRGEDERFSKALRQAFSRWDAR